MKIDIGIMVYNEEKNISQLLETLLNQKLKIVEIKNIFVILSGCTDRSPIIVKNYGRKYPQIKPLVQKKREGKASAVNLFLQNAQSDILVLESGDTIPEKNTIEELVKPFKNPKIGMTGAQIIPLNEPKNFWGFTDNLLWGLHHQVAIRQPKMGEMVAFRKIFQRIPKTSAADEANIEPLVKGQGYQLFYSPKAKVYNRGPENLHDFIAQRRRIYAGHLVIKKEQGYTVATLSGLRIFFLLLRNFKFNWRFIFWTPAVILLEVWGRILGFYDFHFRKKSHAVWEMIGTTKKLK